jgi:hypothetical protein
MMKTIEAIAGPVHITSVSATVTVPVRALPTGTAPFKAVRWQSQPAGRIEILRPAHVTTKRRGSRVV